MNLTSGIIDRMDISQLRQATDELRRLSNNFSLELGSYTRLLLTEMHELTGGAYHRKSIREQMRVNKKKAE